MRNVVLKLLVKRVQLKHGKGGSLEATWVVAREVDVGKGWRHACRMVPVDQSLAQRHR